MRNVRRPVALGAVAVVLLGVLSAVAGGGARSAGSLGGPVVLPARVGAIAVALPVSTPSLVAAPAAASAATAVAADSPLSPGVPSPPPAAVVPEVPPVPTAAEPAATVGGSPTWSPDPDATFSDGDRTRDAAQRSWTSTGRHPAPGGRDTVRTPRHGSGSPARHGR